MKCNFDIGKGVMENGKENNGVQNYRQRKQNAKIVKQNIVDFFSTIILS